MKRLIAVLMLVAAAAAGQTTSMKSAKKTTGKKDGTAAEIKNLRATLQMQQEQMEEQRKQMEQLQAQMKQLLETMQQTSANAEKAQTQLDQAQSNATQAQQTAAEAQRLADQASSNAVEAKTALSLVDSKSKDVDKKVSALQEVLARFQFHGDVRLRGDSLFQNSPGFVDRNRARIRARFGFDSKLNEDFSAGIYVATGSPADVTSANETLTNFFERKTVGVDKAFIAYHPVAHPWVDAVGGKWAFTWARTSLTFDPDINPEGFSEKFSWKLKNSVAKQFTVGAMQLLYNEVSAGTDSYALGGQASGTFQFGPWTATPQFVALKWNNPSAILQASAFAAQVSKAGDSGGGTIFLPGEGPGCASGSAGSSKLPSSAPCALASNGLTNAVFTDANGAPQLLSGYFYTDYLLTNQVKTGIERFPFNLTLEFQDNIDAAQHPLDTKGNVIAGLGPQNKGYFAEASFGETKNKNDLRFGYGFWRQEQDAILATFAESEGRASTNILEHHIFAEWKPQKNVLAVFTLWRGRALNTNLENNAATIQKTISKAGQSEPFLNRYQFDLIYSF